VSVLETLSISPDLTGVGRPIVTATDVWKSYGSGDARVDALAGVSVELNRGEYVAVMGPSGSGKSSLMHVLAGLDTPTSGTVVVDGEELGSLGDRKLTRLRRDRIGFVFQSFNLLPTLSAAENVALPIRIAGKRPDAAWVAELLDVVGLSDRAGHRPSQLSGGQQQRVAVARALVTKPAAIFADEPTGNLDSRSSAVVLELLRDAADRLGQTIVMVTHDAHAAAVADRVLFLVDGQIVRDSGRLTSAEILDVMKELQ
jgi:putative ABC transport system ATP-binding protein